VNRSTAIERKTSSERRPETTSRSENMLDFALGDVVRLRKPHPCGGSDWQVTRIGADIGLRCQTCDRRVLLERAVLEKRLKQFLSRGQTPQPEQSD